MAKLLALKASIKGEDGDGHTGKSKFELKCPKGTRDHTPAQIVIRDHIFNTITEIFKRHGAEGLDTPVFELKVCVIR